MKNTKAALIWITNILKKHAVPFQISGGLAAKIYGAERELDDIDIDIPDNQFAVIQNDVKNFITDGPKHLVSDRWDLFLMTLNYEGQPIDISGADTTKIFNSKTQKWHPLKNTLSNVEMKNVFGLEMPVIARDELIAYKKILSREVDLIDLQYLF